MDKKTKIKVIIFSILFVVVMVGLSIWLTPYMKKLNEPQVQEELQAWINDSKLLGFGVILLIQIVQIVVAFIPGGPLEVVGGALYGPFWTTVICLVGCIIASAFIFMLSKKYGNKFFKYLFKEKEMKHWQWMLDSEKSSMVTFILFLMPGMPKDMLTYFIGATDMTLKRFLILTTIARTPAIVLSAYSGSTVREGNVVMAIIAFVLIGVIGICGIAFKDKIISFCQKKIEKRHKKRKK